MTSSITPYTPNAVRIMITNGGPHPSDFWAQVTAEQIAPINPDITGARHAAALKLQAKIAEALEPHHAKIQETERAKCATDATHHLQEVHPDQCTDQTTEALKAIEEAAKGTEWEIHFSFGHNRPDWYDDRLNLIAERGEDHIPPLTPEQKEHHDKWLRQKTIHDEVARHFASAQHVERSWHADRLAGRA